MTTTLEKLNEIASIKAKLKDAINNKGSDIVDTTPFEEYPSKINALAGNFIETNNVEMTHSSSRAYIAAIDGSEIDTIEKRNTVIQQHCDNARAAGKTEIFFVFRGNIPSFIFSDGSKGTFNPTGAYSSPPVLANIQKVSIVFDSQAIKPTTLSGYRLFFYCESLTSIPQLDTSNVTSMNEMFYGCTSLTSIPQLDTSNVTSMISMFYDCASLTSIPQLDTSKVTSMSDTFDACTSLTTIPQLDTSNVTSMDEMFYCCTSLTTVPQLDTSKVSNMDGMFYGCTSLTSIPQLDTSKVTSMSDMFETCTSLENIDMYGMKVSFSVADTKLGTEALNKLFSNLATVTTSQTITITNTPGAVTCDKSIATAKGWKVVG